MKVCIIGDVHFSQYSSIVRSNGKKYSVRLENLINSLNWAEEQAVKNNCEKVIYLGDFFDHAVIQDSEATALKDIKWNNLPHRFIVGNHESSVNGLAFSSTKVLENDNFKIVDHIFTEQIDDNTCFDYIPYIIEEDRKKSLKDYQVCGNGNRIVFSHNDIKGFQFGGFLSTEGFDIKDIEDNSTLYINGHLHNGDWLTKKIINLGNLTGQNFSEDASKYEHHIMILDTVTRQIDLIENPYAFNFYKFDKIEHEVDVDAIPTVIKDNAVISIRVKDQFISKIKDILDKCSKVVEYRLISYLDEVEVDINQETEIQGKDHLEQFRNFCKDTLGDNEIVNFELTEVTK